mmetsp:Transcript_61026/g.132535  ORF Transcript_61026/g.132535 Transcript_61026/m.132535 type:complete len:559 (+) Transcript_61026:74-1750(+)
MAAKVFDIGKLEGSLKKGGGTLSKAELEACEAIGIYFSAHWCPPCRGFTPTLAKVYEDMKAKGNKVEIIFASSDRSAEDFESYWGEQPWAALPFDKRQEKEEISEFFGVGGIPSLVFVKPDGTLITDKARGLVTKFGAEAFPFTAAHVEALRAKRLAGVVNFAPIVDSGVQMFRDGAAVSASAEVAALRGSEAVMLYFGPHEAFTKQILCDKLGSVLADKPVIYVGDDASVGAFEKHRANFQPHWLYLDPFIVASNKDIGTSVSGLDGTSGTLSSLDGADATLTWLIKCPDGHVSVPFTTTTPYHHCDVCEAAIDAGTAIYRCGTCDHDTCAKCCEGKEEQSVKLPLADLRVVNPAIAEVKKAYDAKGLAVMVCRGDGSVFVDEESGVNYCVSKPPSAYPFRPEDLQRAEAEKMAKFKDLTCLGDAFVDREGKTYTRAEALPDDLDVVGLYFSAHWCGPCKMFTPKLVEIYDKLKAAGKKFEIVFCSSDRNQKAFDEYFATMPWKAIPFEDRDRDEALSADFNVEGIPALFLLSRDGSRIKDDGTDLVLDEAESYPWV